MEMPKSPEGKRLVGIYLHPHIRKGLKKEAVDRGVSASQIVEDILRSRLIKTEFNIWTRGATEVLVIGPTLFETTQEHLIISTWRRRLDDGCDLRFVLMDPESEGLGLLGYWLGRSTDSLSNEIKGSISAIQGLGSYNEKFGRGSVALRIRQTLPWSAARVATPNGVELRIDVLPVPGSEGTRRASLVLGTTDPQFPLVDGQIKALWMSAKDAERKWGE